MRKGTFGKPGRLFARRNFLVPVPEFDDFEVFNEGLAEDCRRDLQRQLRGKKGTKAELLEEDRRAMLPLPAQAFEARRVEPCQANSLSLVRFDRNDYSVPTQHAHHAIVAVGGIERVRFVVQDRWLPSISGTGTRRTSTTIPSITWH